MKSTLRLELRHLFPAWVVCVLLPLPLILFWHSPTGRSFALFCYTFSCAILAAHSFHRDIQSQKTPATSPQSDTIANNWRKKILSLAVAFFAAFVVFSLLSLAVNDRSDFVTPMLAFMVIIPAICIVPYMVLTTRNLLAGVIFSIFLVGSLKTPIGAIIVKTFFPNHFQQAFDVDGSLIMPTPWSHPNLLVWFFYVSTFALSVTFFFLGAKKFRAQHGI